MYNQSLKICSENRSLANNIKNLIKRIIKLELIITSKNDEISSFNKEIDLMKKSVKMLNPKFKVFDEILSAGQRARDFKG